jgi:hypothetical protein
MHDGKILRWFAMKKDENAAFVRGGKISERDA